MIRFLNAYFPTRTVVLGVSEVMLAMAAFAMTMVAWFGFLNASIILNYEQGYGKIGVVACVFILCMYYFDLYDSLVLSNWREVLSRIIQVLGTVCLLLAVIYYFYPPVQLERGVFLAGIVALGLAILVWRRLFLVINSLTAFAERVVVFGDGSLKQILLRELQSRPELGLRVVGSMDRVVTKAAQLLSEPWKSSDAEGLCEIGQMVAAKDASRVIITLEDRRGALPVEDLLKLKTLGVRIQDGVELYEAVTGKVSLESLRPSWLLFSEGFHVSGPLLLYKRLFSLIMSAIALVLALPLMLLIAVAIRLDSPGPVIFRQKRVGKDGKTFTLLKFRSMFDGSDRGGCHKPAETDDDRITRVGAWLRRTRTDELPQLFNILRGDIDFVGPRPFVPDQEEECVRNIPFYRQRWAVRPGATGWAQVNRGYNATLEDNADKLAYDLFYIKNVSIGLDLLIFFKTAKILLLGRGGR